MNSRVLRDYWIEVWVCVLLLLATLAMEQFTNIDLHIQRLFYNAATGRWIVDASAFWPRLLFYNGPKLLLLLFGLWVAGSLLARKPNWRPASLRPPRSGLFFCAAMICVPVAVASLKSFTHVRCPYEILEFGGEHAYLRLYEACCAAAGGRCFPAGHASGGFALMCLYFAGRGSRGRVWGLLTGLTVGWIMALYQMFKGAHFLSHSLTTMFLAALILLGLSRVPIFKLPSQG